MATDDRSEGHRGRTLVVASALAARQWEMVLASAPLSAGAAAWETPPLVPYVEWLERLWQRDPQAVPPLTPAQSRSLWRRVVAESMESSELVAPDGVALWAEEAWQLLLRWNLDPARQRARADEHDFRALLRWCGRYRALLEDLALIDRVELERRLGASAGIADDTVLLDLDDDYPLRAALLERLSAAGGRLARESVPTVASRKHAVRLADSADELRAALQWARAHLAVAPLARVAIVVADLGRRHDEVQRVLDDELPAALGHATWSGGTSLRSNTVVGAAIAALRLLTPTATYADLGRWLRSPVFAASELEREERALLDAALRSDVRAQAPFAVAYRVGGLAQRIRSRAPSTAERLDAALDFTLTERRATPGRWARQCSAFLERLGWQVPRAPVIARGWQAALDGLAQLSPVLGEIGLPTALAELAALLERRVAAPLPLRGVHLLDDIDDVGPGYDAVWLTGFTDTQWPRPARPNPLLPRALQRAHDMPGGSPRAAAQRAARRLARVASRTPLLIASWPARVLDYETEPSPAIRDWPALELEQRAPGVRAQAPRERETVADPPPRFTTPSLPGGAGMLGRQARCPIRAFCEDRLRARPLEPIGFGLPRRVRGTAVHRAAERLLADLPAQADLRSREPQIDLVASRVLREVFGAAEPLLRALYELELAQLRGTLGALLRAEQARAPFQVLAVEQASSIALGEWSIDVRVDRIDRLADGSLAIIDYKTGQSSTSAGWFRPRLQDAQVPLYAVSRGAEIGAAVIARLRPDEAAYSGLWSDAAFPGRPSGAWDGQWPAQLERWRTELTRLAAEFAAGDTRIFVASSSEAAGVFAPLTRVHEQLGLRRGAVRSW